MNRERRNECKVVVETSMEKDYFENRAMNEQGEEE
jgi:hypothetical protein